MKPSRNSTSIIPMNLILTSYATILNKRLRIAKTLMSQLINLLNSSFRQPIKTEMVKLVSNSFIACYLID